MGTSAALTISLKMLTDGRVAWTLRRAGQSSIVTNGVENNSNRAKKAAQHAARMATNQQKEK